MANLPANPGEALWIGPAGGKNHFNVGIGGPGGDTDHTDYDQAKIESGFTLDDRFCLNSTGDVQFKMYVEYGRTSSGTKYARSELRELTPSGARMAFSTKSGEHYMKGRTRLDHAAPPKPWVCFFQIHDAQSDLARVQYEDGVIVCRRTPPGGSSEIRTVLRSGVTLGTWIAWEMRFKDNGRMIIMFDGVEVLNVTGMGQDGCYFKAGCYNQVSNTAAGGGATSHDYCQVTMERGSFECWHTGSPAPTVPDWSGTTDPGGGPGTDPGTGADTQPPSSPTGLTVTPQANGVLLTWDEATDNVGVDHYNVYRSTGAGGSTGGSTGGGTGGSTGGGTADMSTAAGRFGWGTPLPSSDEFDYTGPPDSTKWSVYNSAGHAGNGVRSPSRVEVKNGKMILTGLAGSANTAGLAHKLGQQYGRWEVRCRSFYTADPTRPGDQSGGYHPVLIVWPTSDSWPADGEYDFLENGEPGMPAADAFMHYPSLDGSNHQIDVPDHTLDLREFHNFAFEWTPDEVTGYIDGVEWFSYSGGAASDRKNIQAMPEGQLTIQLDAFQASSLIASTFEIEWARVYPLTALPGGGGSNTGGGTATKSFGKTTAGSATTTSSADKLVASKFTAADAGTLTAGHARVWVTSGSTPAKMAVYADSSGAPGALLATSDQVTVSATSAGVQDFVFSGGAQISITAGTAYWLAVTWDDPGTPSITYSRGTETDARKERSDITYGTPPGPFGTPTGSFQGPIDAWADVTVSTGVGGGGSTTTTQLGKTTDGTSSTASSTAKTGVSSFTASASGTLDAGHARAWLDASGSGPTKVVVYANSSGAPGALLAASDELAITATSEALRNYTFSGANRIAITSGTTYWVGLAWQDPGSPGVVLSRDGTASQRQEALGYAPNPFGTPTAGAGPVDVYVDVVSTTAPPPGGPGVGQTKIAEVKGTSYLDTAVQTSTSRSVGVGGIPTPAPGPNVVLASADSSSRLTISTGGTPGSPRIYDGRGHSVAGVTVRASDVVVQNYVIHGCQRDGVSIDGGSDRVTVQNCDFYGITDNGTGDINAITLFGNGHRVLYNTFGVTDFLVSGDPGGSHTDIVQTWNTPTKRSTSDLIVQGNRVVGPHTSDNRFIHNFVQGEGKNSTDGGGGGTGTSSGWLIADNSLEADEADVNLLDIHDVKITRNTFALSTNKIVGLGDGSSGIVFYSDNDLTGATYNTLGVSITSGSGPPGIDDGSGSGAPAPTYTYAVTAVDAAGNESGQPGGTGSSGAPLPVDTDPPTVPTNLTATAGDARVALTWDAATDDGTGVDRYYIYRGGGFQAATRLTSWVDTDLANGTTYSYTVSALDRASNESEASAPATATPAATPVLGAALLPRRLAGGKVEVAVAWGADLTVDQSAWAWTDVTADVRFDPGVHTALGRNDESGTSNPAALTLVLDNSTGAYSLGGRSVHWPYVRRNTPVRVRVDPGDGGGGRVLFFGFADGWTPGWDALTGAIPIVTLSASGTLRRMRQGAAPLQSAYRRVATNSDTVVAYWPMEEGKSARFAPAVRGGTDMALTGRPDWEADDSFDCSRPLPTLQDGRFVADVAPYPDTGKGQVRFLLSVPSDGLADGTVLMQIAMTGSIARWDITYELVNGAECLGLFRYNASDGALNSSDTIAFALKGKPGRVSLDWSQSGSSIAWTLAYKEADPDVPNGLFFAGSVAGTAGLVRKIDINPNRADVNVALGHVTVEDTVTSVFTDADALVAHVGEPPTGDFGRLFRLAEENRVPMQIYGAASQLGPLDQLGPQLVAPLVDLLEECALSDQGQLWDGRNAGLSYTTRRRRELGTVKLTIDAAAGQLAGNFEPVDDDQRNRNRMQVTRLHGVTVVHEDADGPVGTATVGIYDDSATINNRNDSMMEQYAQWLVSLGTVTGYRYPSVTVDLAAAPELAAAVLDIVPGERVDVTNLDDTLAGFPDDRVSLLVEGIAHEISPHAWRVTFRCSPASPWLVGEVAQDAGDTSDMAWRVDTDGSTLAVAAAAGATSLSVATTTGALWTLAADDYPLYLSVGGLKVRATACTSATSPQALTVDPLPLARAAGAPVELWDPRPIGLG